MNIRKLVYLSAMFAAPDALIATELPQMDLYKIVLVARFSLHVRP